jgi:glucose/arabinose dehydrogenase
LLPSSAFAYLTVPSGFVVENAVPGAAFDTPTGIAFLPDGRMLVTLKEGTVWMVQNGSKLPGQMLDLRRVVLNQGDRGLLDVAVDPNFGSNRYLYFVYVVDPDSNMVDNNDDAYSRLVRYQLPIGSNFVDTTTRAVLFGRSWPEGPPSGSESHTDGSLRWGVDGSLMVSIGDGAQFDGVDQGGDDPGLFQPGRTNPLEDIGAYRAQYVGSLAGKILRPIRNRARYEQSFLRRKPGTVRSRACPRPAQSVPVLRGRHRQCQSQPRPARKHLPRRRRLGELGRTQHCHATVHELRLAVPRGSP